MENHLSLLNLESSRLFNMKIFHSNFHYKMECNKKLDQLKEGTTSSPHLLEKWEILIIAPLIFLDSWKSELFSSNLSTYCKSLMALFSLLFSAVLEHKILYSTETKLKHPIESGHSGQIVARSRFYRVKK